MNIFLQNAFSFKLLMALFMACGLISCHRAQRGIITEAIDPFEGVDTSQVNAVLSRLTVEEKIGQLILWQPVQSQLKDKEQLYRAIARGSAGGMILENLDLQSYLQTTDSCRRLARLPLFFGTTQKVSLHNHFIGLARFPLPATVGAIDSVAIVEELEKQFIDQCKALGISFCLSPTLKMDEPSNIGYDFQTFGNDTAAVLEWAHFNLFRLRQHRLLAFGDDFSSFLFEENDTIREAKLHLIKTMNRAGLPGLLINNKVFESDTLQKAPPSFLRKYLAEYLDFKGLTIGIFSPQRDEQIVLSTDLVITSDLEKAFQTIWKTVRRGRLTELDLDNRVRKVLMAKAWANKGDLLYRSLAVDTLLSSARLVNFGENNISDSLVFVPPSKKWEHTSDLICSYFEDPRWIFYIRDLFEKSIVIPHNANQLLPLSTQLPTDFRIIEFTRRSFNDFRNLFSKYADYTTQTYNLTEDGFNVESLDTATGHTRLVILLDSLDISPSRHRTFITRLNELTNRYPAVVINFGNPKNLRFFDTSVSSIQVFERNDFTESYAAQVLFGGAPSLGKMPVAIGEHLSAGSSVKMPVVRLGYSIPEKTGIAAQKLVGIDAIVGTAIDRGVFPGCQVAIAKDGLVIYSKAFGSQTYGERTAVHKTNLYDVASVTKIAATTLAVMKLTEERKLKLKDKLGAYLDLPGNKPLEDVRIAELLTHQSGLQAQMPIARFYSWRNVPQKGCNDYFCKNRKEQYDVQVADGLFLRNDLPDSIWQRVFRLPVSKRKHFCYSDVNFFVLQKLVEKLSGQSLDAYLSDQFYQPLGLRHLTFHPLQRFSKNEIVPTEKDQTWRKALVHGFVHDPAAALMGGIGGSAGVFSNAEDLAALFQMFVRGGDYGGIRYFDSNTVKDFTAGRHGSHRALGFDKPTAARKYPSYSRYISPDAYGHTGFTGTCVWVDPSVNLVYVFLSNRVHPSSRNGKIFSEAVRSRIHDVVYSAFDTYQFEIPTLEMEAIVGEKE